MPKPLRFVILLLTTLLVSSSLRGFGTSTAFAQPVLLYQKDGAATNDGLGYSVAGAGDVDGDGKADFIIGAYAADPGGRTDAGSAYLYSGADGSLLYQKDGAAVGDGLGYSVAGAGDVNGDGKADFIIGAYHANPGGRNDAGSAFVYSGATGLLLFQKDGAAGFDYLGISVARAGDVNGDGRADFIVGASNTDPGGRINAGSAFVYSGATGLLLFQKDGAAASNFLGISVAGAGDANGDGKDDFIIGTPLADPGGLTNAGSAFVYSGATGLLLFQKDGAAGFDVLGWSVAGAGDVDGDGKADFIIGAYTADPGGRSSAGSAFVYSGADGTLLFQKDGAAAGDQLGWSVAGAGDLNGDGKADFIIGAYTADPGGRGDAGSAYLYSGADGALLYQKDGAAAGDFLGYSVAGAGDLNGDGKADFIIGAYQTDPGGLSNAGSAYVYGLTPTDAPDEKKNRPLSFQLSQNYPNPFNPTTTIRFYLPKRQNVTVEIFNTAGQRVKTLLKGEQSAGEHILNWDGKDEKGNILSSGVYFYNLEGEDFFEAKKMIFLK